MKPFDPSLYLITDRRFGGSSLVDSVARAVSGGVTLVQLRDKEASSQELVELTRALLAILRPRNIPLLINDRVDIALMTGADGVHLGLKDDSPRQAKARLGSDAIVGMSVETDTDFASLSLRDVDYIAASPVFHTTTKKDIKTPFGLDGLRDLRRKCHLPLVAIGGVTEENADSVFAAGVDGIAVITAILGKEDERAAAFRLKQRGGLHAAR